MSFVHRVRSDLMRHISVDRCPTALRRMCVALFDRKLRREMDARYSRQFDPWGREGNLDQVRSATTLVTDRAYQRCLDVGTGLGYFAEAVAACCDVCIALDISEVAIQRARQRLVHVPNIRWVCGNIRVWVPEQRFDLIILGDVLYYWGDTLAPQEFAQVLDGFPQMLMDDGRLLLTHYVDLWRDAAWFYSKYLSLFEKSGLRMERHETFAKGEKLWIHVVLQKV